MRAALIVGGVRQRSLRDLWVYSGAGAGERVGKRERGEEEEREGRTVMRKREGARGEVEGQSSSWSPPAEAQAREKVRKTVEEAEEEGK